MKIFGREPAMLLAFLASALMVFSHFVYPLSIDQQGAFNAVAVAGVGIVTAWAVAEDGGLALIVGLCKAVIAVAISWGLQWDQATQALVMTFVTISAQLFVRQNVVAPIKADGSQAVGKALNGGANA